MMKCLYHYGQVISPLSLDDRHYIYIEVMGKRSFHYDGVLVIMAGNDALQTRNLIAGKK